MHSYCQKCIAWNRFLQSLFVSSLHSIERKKNSNVLVLTNAQKSHHTNLVFSAIYSLLVGFRVVFPTFCLLRMLNYYITLYNLWTIFHSYASNMIEKSRLCQYKNALRRKKLQLLHHLNEFRR